MADENAGARQWIVEPPRPGEISIYVAGGEGAELTDQQEDALSALLRSLEADDAEVTGHAKCSLRTCNQVTCSPVRCGRLICNFLTAQATGAATSWNLMGSFGVSGQ